MSERKYLKSKRIPKILSHDMKTVGPWTIQCSICNQIYCVQDRWDLEECPGYKFPKLYKKTYTYHFRRLAKALRDFKKKIIKYLTN